MENMLLCTDVYKLSHMEMYPEKTNSIFSYMEARKPNVPIVFFGLEYYFSKLANFVPTTHHVDEALEMYYSILGTVPDKVRSRFKELQEVGYLPLQITSPVEGTITQSQNAILGVTNTLADFGWLVGYYESYFLKLWNTCTVATRSAQYRALVELYAEETCDNKNHIPYSVHDFGYRGVSSEETAALSGAAHLVPFKGTDTVPAVKLIKEFYGVSGAGSSVPATEHSVMCSYGDGDEELEALETLLDKYPTGLISIVADTYDYFNWLSNVLPKLKDKILAREGKVVVRPDSGNPKEVLLGDGCELSEDNGEDIGTFEILARTFGYTVNKKGYKELNPKIGVIYGDGMYFNNFKDILKSMKEKRWASNNLVIGVGGLLLQNHSRDDFGFSLKASAISFTESDADYDRSDYNPAVFSSKPLQKDPKTDPTKKSKSGLLLYNESFSNPYVGANTISIPPVFDESGTFETPMFELQEDNHYNTQILTIDEDEYESKADFNKIRQRFELYFSICKDDLLNLPERNRY